MQNKYKYPELERVDRSLGRYYKDSNDNLVPSVTTVLSNTSIKSSGINDWKNRVGETEANRVIKQSTDIGTYVHEALENYLNGSDWDNFGDDYESKISQLITKKFITAALVDINQVWGLEVGLILDSLYAGTADCVGEYKNIPTLIDFKTAKRIKKREWIEDYFLQGCAYANAHNVMFNTSINQVVILMVDRDLIFEKFVVEPKEFEFLTKKWKQRLIAFDKLNKE